MEGYHRGDPGPPGDHRSEHLDIRRTIATLKAYRNSGEFILIIFDLRIPGAVAGLNSERAAWQEYADIEMLNIDHAVLIVRPGAARRGRAHMERIAERLDGVAAEVTIYSWHESPEIR
jgi:hypothetical protein